MAVGARSNVLGCERRILAQRATEKESEREANE